MVKKLATAVVVLSAVLAAPAQAATKYYQQTVTGSTQAQCEAAGTALAQQKQAEGYLVTWVGCGYSNFRWAGLVGWSD
ncbi:hypothetical protein [Amycolatopsis sp. NPDC098790]|uniref:hypothetical protein n=1 Tax=Amycolatopsis sp. NPDC098790 TaxID=3363939 RepID=UPI0037FD02FF